MLILVEKKLIIFSLPKTGTTSIDNALGKGATIRFQRANKYGLKHITPLEFKLWKRALKKQYPKIIFETCVVMREPLDWIRSWYKFRTRKNIKSTKRFTGDISFDQFLNELNENKIKSKSKKTLLNGQSRFLFPNNEILIDRIFPYDNFDAFIDFISNKIGKKLEIPKSNISPNIEENDLIIKKETLQKIEENISLDKKIYDFILRLGSFNSNNIQHKNNLEDILNNT